MYNLAHYTRGCYTTKRENTNNRTPRAHWDLCTATRIMHITATQVNTSDQLWCAAMSFIVIGTPTPCRVTATKLCSAPQCHHSVMVRYIVNCTLATHWGETKRFCFGEVSPRAKKKIEIFLCIPPHHEQIICTAFFFFGSETI